MAEDESHQHGLQSLGLDIFKIFKSLIETPWIGDEVTASPLQRNVELEEERFGLWAQSLGLNQAGHASLDYRVRDAPVIVASLADLLSDLKHHLENRKSVSHRPCKILIVQAKFHQSFLATDYH